jgi:hypothetical protein
VPWFTAKVSHNAIILVLLAAYQYVHKLRAVAAWPPPVELHHNMADFVAGAPEGEHGAFQSLVSPDTPCRASSVLRRNVRQFGPSHVFDGREDTCWNSDQGSPQTLELRFPAPVHVAQIVITFQGGFVGQDVDFYTLAHAGPQRHALPAAEGEREGELSRSLAQGTQFKGGQAEVGALPAWAGDGAWAHAGHAEPDETSDEQVFALSRPVPSAAQPAECSSAGTASSATTGLRIVFGKSTDFYGRVTVYRLDVRGWLG